MITRIIRFQTTMPFDDFVKYMNSIKNEFTNIEGCKQLEVLQDKYNNDIYFIYTIWKNDRFLNKFRKSKFNKEFWNKVNEMSISAPQVWSVENIFEK